jgi:hypothetical protein
MTEFLHEIVRERNFNQDTMESVNTWVDPWDIPISYTLIDDIVHPTSDDLGVS